MNLYVKIAIWTAVGIAALIVLSIIVKNINGITENIKKLFRPYKGDFSDPVDPSRETELQKLAQQLNQKVNSVTDNAIDTLEKINNLNDSEFKYLVQYYNSYFPNNIWEDVDYEYLWGSDADEIFQSRYSGMGF